MKKMEDKGMKHGRRNERREGMRKEIVEVTTKEREKIEENW
jgi:hypothetical protein